MLINSAYHLEGNNTRRDLISYAVTFRGYILSTCCLMEIVTVNF